MMKKKVAFLMSLSLIATGTAGVMTDNGIFDYGINTMSVSADELSDWTTVEFKDTDTLSEHFAKEQQFAKDYYNYLGKKGIHNAITHYASNWTDMRYSYGTKDNKTYLVDVGIINNSSFDLYSHNKGLYYNLGDDEGTSYYFNEATSPINLEISDGIKEIGAGCFKYAEDGSAVLKGKGLGTVNFDATYSHVEKIGDEAFRGNPNLKSVELRLDIQEIGAYAFADCTSLSMLGLSNDIYHTPSGGHTPFALTTVGDGAFSNTGLTSLVINSPIINVGSDVFANCRDLKSIVYTSPIVGEGMFRNCSKLSDVRMSPIQINKGAFENDKNITSLSLGNYVETIGENAFKGTSITSMDLPNSLGGIAMNAFDDCTSLTTLTIRNPDTILKGTAKNTGLQKIYGYEGSTAEKYAKSNNIQFVALDSDNNECGANATWTYDSSSKVLKIQGSGKVEYTDAWDKIIQNTTKLEISEGITEIGDYTFRNFKNLTNVKLPNTLKTIGVQSFLNVTKVKYFEIPASVETIKNQAIGFETSTMEIQYFLNEYTRNYDITCSLLAIEPEKAINQWTNIVHSAYSNLSIVSLGGTTGNQYANANDINFIDNSETHYECGVNATWKFDEETKTLTISGKGSVEFAYDWNKLKLLEKAENIVIEEGITEIDENTFNNFVNVVSVKLPESIKVIKKGAFTNTNLEYIYIPSGIEKIGKGADDFTTSEPIVDTDTTVLVEEGSIGAEHAERHELPLIYKGKADSNKYYGSCGDNATWNYDATKKELSINGSGDLSKAPWLLIMNNVESIPVSSISIAEGITGLDVNGAFSHSDFAEVTELVIPEGVTTIGDNAFSSLEKLKKITLPVKSLVTMGDGAFDNCPMLKEMTINSYVKNIGEKAVGYVDDLVNPDFTIYGYNDTKAQEYAGVNKINFIDLNNIKYMLGDINDDGSVNVLDCILLKNKLLYDTEFNYRELKASDVNVDGEISSMDLVMLKKHIVGLINLFE